MATTTMDKDALAAASDDAAPQSPETSISDRVTHHKDRGNAHFAAKRYPDAIISYQAGLLHAHTGNERDLEVALRSNLAMALLKMENFSEAEQECSQALELDPTNSKVWYRRALAREGQQVAAATAEDRISLLEGAVTDLEICLTRITATTSQANNMKRAARQALDRIQHELQQQQPQQQHQVHYEEETNGNKHSMDTTTTPPTPSRQRQDVARLLLARNVSPQQEGEAFFLLDHRWWTAWCRHVDFFYQNQNDQQLQQQQRYETILRLLPPGAVLPRDLTAREEDDDDEDTSSSSSTSSEDHVIVPQEIDNSALLQSADPVRLKPNLVRGHHYELIPREVYNALRIWYGEVTPSICRRVNEACRLPLYEDAQELTNGDKGHHCGACRAPCASARCRQCLTVHYCSRSCQESHWPYHKAQCKQLAAAVAGEDAGDTREVVPNNDNWGRVGLHNLGNTCFMNSALQCLSHATPLTRHFLSNRFKQDVNTSNPLGTGGKLANAYEIVMKDIWMKSNTTSTSPTALKRAIAMFAPRFAGCLQHDSQEFLAYLLDGLHEDLNRIRKAPYVKMPDVVGPHTIAGAEAWDAHLRRNDSLVMDTFYGQFKSTCVCPKCERVSVSFDAFNHVSLEIPQLQDMARTIPILLSRAASSGETTKTLPIRYGVTVKRGSFAVDLRRALSELCGIPPGRLAICDVYEHTIYEILQDNKPVSTIRNTDVLAAYEVDPYTDTTIHAVATHALLSKNSPATELEASAETKSSSLEAFGFPFLTSFDSQLTCKQVWEHVWIHVKSMVAPDLLNNSSHPEAGEHGSADDGQRSLLQIRIVDNAGRSRPVFLDDVDVSMESVDEEVDRASILPSQSDEKLMMYLGTECAERFLFLRLEWLGPSSRTEPTEEEKVQVYFDKERFTRYIDHPSLAEALKKQRASNGAKGVTLDQCFDTFTKPERLDEHNMWYCSRCKEHVRGMKTMELWRLPDILIVHLKRFEFKHTLRREKLDTFVNFPLDGLDMSKHCASAQATEHSFVDDHVPVVYDLFAVTNHYGRMGFGHYTAFARRWDERGMSNDWALFDDSGVRSVGDGTGRGGMTDGVVSPAAYVLFYRRRK